MTVIVRKEACVTVNHVIGSEQRRKLSPIFGNTIFKSTRYLTFSCTNSFQEFPGVNVKLVVVSKYLQT